MKNIIISLITLIILASCSQQSNSNTSVDALISSGNKSEITKKKNELKAQQQIILNDLKKIEKALNSDSKKGNNPLVTTFITEERNFNHYLEIQGNVVTKQNIILFAQYAGTLTNMYVKEGQHVTKGQILARIDDAGLSQQIAQMEIQVSLAKTTYERQKRLWDQKIGSEMQYLQTEATYKAQQNAIKHLEAQLEKTVVRAPFNGIIDDVFSEQGSVVAPGQSQLLRIVNLKNMYIEAEIPESHLKNVVKGKMVSVYFPILNKTINTKIRQVGNYINPNNRSFKIEIGIENKSGEIKPNLTARLKINDYTSPNAILIPQSIISENAESQQYVYVVSDKTSDNKAQAKRVIIKTGLTQEDLIEVLSGIDINTEIIKEGARNIREGQIVKILSN